MRGPRPLNRWRGCSIRTPLAALVALLPKTPGRRGRQVLTHLVGAIPTAVPPLCEMLKHPDGRHRSPRH